jgi:hypothetical protein
VLLLLLLLVVVVVVVVVQALYSIDASNTASPRVT